MNIKKDVAKNKVKILVLLMALVPITVTYASSVGDIIIPLFTGFDDAVVTNEGFLKVKGEISDIDVEDYHGKYEEEWSFYERVLALLEFENNRASALEHVYQKNNEGLDFLIQTIKVGKKLWEYSKIIGVIEYSNSVLFVTEHKIKNFYPVIFIKIVKENGNLYIDMSKENDFLLTELINLLFHNREKHSKMVFPRKVEQIFPDFTDFSGWENVSVIDGVEYFFKSRVDHQPDEKLEWDEIISFLESDQRTFRKVEKLISKENSERYKRWLKSMSVDINDQAFISDLLPSNLHYIGKLRINENCKVAFFEEKEERGKKEPFYLCRTKKGFILHNLMIENGLNKRYSDAEFIDKLF